MARVFGHAQKQARHAAHGVIPDFAQASHSLRRKLTSDLWH
jgi:hypothetical protein